MIETEKKTIDIEEFSPTEPIFKENVIRHLVRLASLIVIGLLGVSVVQNYIPDFEVYTNILSPMLIFTLMLVFLAGIFLAFFQLRWVNEKRNKSTNLGGTVGLFGLLLTLIGSVSSLIIPLAILISLLGFGLLLTLVGFFAEMTRIDEPLVFWFRVNLEVIIRYTITIAGALLVNWSALMIVSFFLVDWGVLPVFVWPGDLIGGLVIGGIGMGLVWGSWFHKINQTIWNYRVEIVRTIELSVSQGLILVALMGPFLDPNFLFLSSIFGITGLAIFYLDLYIFKVKVTSHFSKGFVTLSQVFASITGLILILIGIIQTQTQLIPDWFFFSLYFPVTGLLLLYRVWFDNINHTVKRTVQTIVWFFRTYYREVITTFGVSFMALGSFLFDPFLMDLLIIDSLFDPVPLGLFLGGFVIGVAIWHIPDRHVYFRGVTTILSAIVVLWGILLLGLLLIPQIHTDVLSYVISTTMIVMGISFNGWIWRSEIYHSIKSTLIALKNAIVYTYNAIVQFLKTYYRELITTGALSFMVYGLVITWTSIIDFPYWPFLFLLIGYIVSVAIWHIPNRHNYFRGVTTTLSTAVIFFCFLLLLSPDYEAISWLSGGLVVIGVVVNGTLWRKELKQLVIQTAITIKNALVQTGQAIKNFFIAVKDSLIQAGSALIQFVDETLHTIYDHRIAITRAFMTTIGAILTITSFLLLIGFEIVFLTWVIGLEPLFLIFGFLLLYTAWFHQVNQFIKQSAIVIGNALVQTGHALYNFLREVKIALIEALRTIYTYRIVILRAFATILGPLMILSVPFVPLLDITPEAVFGIQLVLLIVGIGILYTAWFYQVNQFVKQLSIAIRDATAQTAHAVYNLLVVIKTSIVTFFRYIFDHRIDIVRAISTITGSIFILAGLFPTPELNYVNIRFVLILGGIIILYIAWLQHINHFVKLTAVAIQNALVQTARAIKNFFVAVKIAIIQTLRAINQFFQTYYIEIIRYSATCIGVLSFVVGLMLMFQDPLGLLLIGGGLVILYAAWSHQVNRFIKQTLQAIKDTFVHAVRVIQNFLTKVKNALVQTFYALGSFLKKAGNQLEQLFGAAIDMIIPIVLITLAISVSLYGFIVLISGLIDPSGVQMSNIFLSIPILGPILDFSASIIQGGSYDGNLLGVFVEQIFLIPLGAALIVVGVVMFLFVALKKEDIRLKSLLNSDSNKGGK